jgi:hypothetical protein
MSDSILISTKKALGLEADYTDFDADIIMHINSVFSTLNQLGIGPDDGFVIEDAVAVWADFLALDLRFNAVKTYMYLRVRLIFDPPSTSYLIDAIKEQIKEQEWRLSTVREGDEWTAPPVPVPEVIDGGGAF